MKFYFFHLMPWPYLPEDFREKYDSAWVTVPNELYDPELGHGLYHRYLDELEMAEGLGYDGICVNEHHQTAYGLMPSPNIMAAMLARRTKSIKIAIVGNALPLRDHPLRVAEEVAMLDVITGGRIISGFVRGTGSEYHSFSMNPTTSKERFREAHDLIIRAWTEPGPFHFYGKHYRFRYVNPWPKPLQDPHPPIWLPSQGSPDTIRMAAKHRYTYCQTYSDIARVKQSFDAMYEAAESFGYTANPEQIGWALPIYVAETDEQAHREARVHLEYFFHYLAHRTTDLYTPTGYVPPQARKKMIEKRTARFTMTYEELYEKRYFLIGSPQTVRQQLAEYSKELGVGTLIAFLHFGSLPHELTVKNLTLFAREVMPYFRKVGFADSAPAG